MTTDAEVLNGTFTSIDALDSDYFKPPFSYGEVRAVTNGDEVHLIGIEVPSRNKYSICIVRGTGLGDYARNARRNASSFKWKKSTLDADPNESSIAFQSSKRLGVVVVNGVTLIFWVDTKDQKIYATRVMPGVERDVTDWCQILVPLSETDETAGPVQVQSAGVCAFVGTVPNEVLICFVAKNSAGVIQICQFVLNYGDYGALKNIWKSSGPTWTLPQPNVIPQPSTGSPIDVAICDVRSIVALVPPPKGPASIFQFVAFWIQKPFSDPGKSKLVTFAVKLDKDTLKPATSSGLISLEWPDPIDNTKTLDSYAGDGIALVIDPAGRLVAVFGDRQTYKGDVGFMLIDDLQPLVADSAEPLKWRNYTLLSRRDQDDDQEETSGPVSVIFCTSDRPMVPVSKIPQYEITMGIFWIVRSTESNTHPVVLGSFQYAIAQMDGKTIRALPDKSTKRFIATICDAFPLPQPSFNLWGNATPDGMADWLLFEYALLNSRTKTDLVETNWKIGGAVEFTAASGGTIFGLGGLFAQGRLATGATFSTAESTSTYTARGMKVQTKAMFHPLGNREEATQPYAIRPYGSYAAHSMVALYEVSLTISALAFSPAGSTKSIVSYAAVKDPKQDDTVVGDFFAYACVPGDVESYLEQNINLRMKALYEQFEQEQGVETAAGIFSDVDKDGNPVDLSKYYKGGNYFADVLRDYGDMRNMLNYRRDAKKAEGEAPLYVSFALSGGSVSDGSYMVTTGESFGWGGYVDFNFYVGRTFGGNDGGGAGQGDGDNGGPGQGDGDNGGPGPGAGDNGGAGPGAGDNGGAGPGAGDNGGPGPGAGDNGGPGPANPANDELAQGVPAVENPVVGEGNTQPGGPDAPHNGGGTGNKKAQRSGKKESEIKGGVEFSFSRVNTSRTENTTAISMNTYINPLSSTQSLTARLFGFRPAKIWALELQYFPGLAKKNYLAELTRMAEGKTLDQPLDKNPDIARVISNPSSLLFENSKPARFMLAISNWDAGGYPLSPDYTILVPPPPRSVTRSGNSSSSTNTGSTNTGSTNTGSTNTGPTNTGSTNTGSTNTGSTNTGQTNTGQTNTGSTNTGQTNTGQTNQAPETRQVIAYNTGMGTTTDPNYRYGDQQAFVIAPRDHWREAPEGTSWISFSPTHKGTYQDYAYDTTVTINGADLSTLTVNGVLAADDTCRISVNDTPVESPWTSSSTPNEARVTDFAIPGRYFSQGPNKVTFTVTNSGGGSTGLFVVFDKRFTTA